MMKHSPSLTPLGFIMVVLNFQSGIQAEDWPTFQHDNRRSAVTDEALALPLKETWSYTSPAPPQTAWTAPAKWNAYSGNDGLQSMRNFDPCFYVSAVGDRLYFGSSVDNAAHCLDAQTGKRRWLYHTDSAVRMPPSIDGGRAYFGSDDGKAYAVDATSGSLLWTHSPQPKARRIPNNGKLISPWPVRTGVLVDSGVAYYGASLLPWQPSYVCAVDAVTGRGDGAGRYVSIDESVTLQGALLASRDSLYVPQGRSTPLRYQRGTGSRISAVEGMGGVYCILTEDEQFVAGPNNQKAKDDVMGVKDPQTNEAIVSFNGSNRVLIDGAMAYLHQGQHLQAVDRKQLGEIQRQQAAIRSQIDKRKKEWEKLKKAGEAKDLSGFIGAQKKDADAVKALAAEIPKCTLWRVTQAVPLGFMLAGEHLVVGLDGEVAAFAAESGELLWKAPVEGKAYGLAYANGRLFVSTDRGGIHAFARVP